MDTHNLQAFLLVAQSGSFSAAAEQLHLTQPAVSKRVAALEQQLGRALFDRIGRTVTLTEAGSALIPHAKSIWQSLAHAEQSIRDLSGDVSGRLSLATSHHIGLHRLPPVLRNFNARYPGVKLDIDFMDSEQAYEQVLHGRTELAVVTLAPEGDTSIVATPIWPDPLDFMVSSEHPLARGKHITLQELARHPVILPGLNTYTGQIVKRLFDQQKLNLDVAMSTNYLETIRMMASIGLGWTVLPRSMGDARLRALQVDVETPQRQLGYIFHRGRSLSNAAQAFVDELSASVDELSAS
jgi:DNA-binding transcriptional LysR family regulator